MQNNFSKVNFPKVNFSKIVVWGFPLHSHTHSYIFFSFVKAFKHLGYDTYWLNNDSDISNLNFENSLFLTEYQVEQKIPVLNSCKYVAHSIAEINPQHPFIPTLTLDVFKYNTIINCKKINEYTYEDSKEKLLIQP